jgi:hypothetical protein
MDTKTSYDTNSPMETKTYDIPVILSPIALFLWLISHQPAVLFSRNKPARSIFLPEQISTSHQSNEKALHFHQEKKLTTCNK